MCDFEYSKQSCYDNRVGTLFVVGKQPFHTKSEMSQLEPVQVGTME